MRTLREWLHRLLATARPQRSDEDLREELRLHAEMAAAAGRRDGGAAQAMDALRDQRGLPWLGDFARDVRHGLRSLAGTPGFAAVALLTLALGIGANTAIFSVVNGVMLQPLAYAKPEQLMLLTTTRGAAQGQSFVSPPEYMEFRELNQSFSAVGAYRTVEMNFTTADRPMRVRAAFADEHLLKALGVQAAHGRLFAAGETDVTGPVPGPGQAPPRRRAIAILSYELWQAAFGGRPMVGETIEANGVRGEVIGIMPPGMDVMDNHVELWLPLGLNPANRQNRANHVLTLVGRLKDGVTARSAQLELDALVESWPARVGVTPGPGAAGHVFEALNAGRGGHTLQMTPLQDAVVGSAGRPMWILQAAVGLVLLIACANLANLLLARAGRRQREFALRLALGAGRGQLVRQLVTEGLVLSTAGGALGLLLAGISIRTLIRAYPTTLPRTGEIALDPLVLVFTLAVSTVCGVLFGLTPIMHTRVRRLMSALKTGGAQGATRSARHHVRGGLVAAEVALAVVLVVGAALLARTVYNLATVEAGLDRARLVTFSVSLPGVDYPQASARRQAYQRLLEELRAVSGVEAATAMSGLPPMRAGDRNDTDIDNYEAPPEGPYENVDFYQYVMDGYFETMGVPIVAGRGFERADAASQGRFAVVNKTLANTFWRGQDPIGQRLRPCCGDQVPWYTIIGVAADVRQDGVDRAPGTEVYFFAEQELPSIPDTMNMVLRMSPVGYLNAALPAAALLDAFERVVHGVDPGVPVVRLRYMDEVFAEAIRRPTLIAQLFGAFAGLALLLAGVGTYGVLSYTVLQRRREIGVRLALGANRRRVLREVMTQGLAPAGAGVVIGLAGALGLGQFIASLLFGIQPTDPATVAAVAAMIALVAAAACGLPAWRASRLDPNLVLREE
jgi:predicted permease